MNGWRTGAACDAGAPLQPGSPPPFLSLIPPLGISPTTHTLFKLKRDICERIFSVVSVNDVLHRLPPLSAAWTKNTSRILSRFILKTVSGFAGPWNDVTTP